MAIRRPIRTTDKIITVTGKVFHTDRRRRIDLKKPVRQLFGDDPNVQYVMELCLSKKHALSRVEQLTGKNVVPVLLYFTDSADDNYEMQRMSKQANPIT